MVRHILGISGGKDSAALAIYMKNKYPDLKVEYYNSDTGCELAETELLIARLDSYLGGSRYCEQPRVAQSLLRSTTSSKQAATSYRLRRLAGVPRK